MTPAYTFLKGPPTTPTAFPHPITSTPYFAIQRTKSIIYVGNHTFSKYSIHDLSTIISEPDQKQETESGEINPEYKKWTKSDQLVLTWIRSTVSPSVQAMILHCVTSKEAWRLLDRFLSPLCSIHLKSLRTKLHTTKKKTDVTMSEYLMDVRATVDALRAAGSSIEEEEIIDYVVDGLDESYRSFLTHLHFNPTTSFDELVSHLLQEEDLLKRTGGPTTNPIVFVAQQVPTENNPTHILTNNNNMANHNQNNYNHHRNNFRGRQTHQRTRPILRWSLQWGT